MSMKLGSQQQKRTAKELIAVLNETFPSIGFPDPSYNKNSTYKWHSEVDAADTPIGKVRFHVYISQLGLFLHCRAEKPENFYSGRVAIWKGFNTHSGKYNLHEHRSQYDSFDDFLSAVKVATELHVRDIMDYQTIA